MTFTTLQYNGVEKPLADWGIGQASREVSNQAHDHFACDMMLPFDTTDPIPYGAQIIVRLGREASGSTNAAGLPVSGITAWTGGSTWFVGWRVDEFRTGSANLEKLDFKFAGPWEFFFERLVFQKLWWTWNGIENVADWRSQIILGQSANALVGANDTIPGTNATNLMSIRQQVAEIIAYVVSTTTTVYGSAQIQSDPLTNDTSGNYNLLATPGTNLIIPDYIAGVYQVAGKTSATALLETVLRAPLDAVNDITCAEALRRELKWIGPMGEAIIWFDYTTTSGGNPCPTLHVSTVDQLPAVSLAAVGQTAALKIRRRDDLIPQFVALKFKITGTAESGVYTEVINDIAGTVSGSVVEGIGQTGALVTVASFAGGSPAYVGGALNSSAMQALQNGARGFAAVTATVDMEGNQSSVAYCTIATTDVDLSSPVSGGTPLAFWSALFPELAHVTSPDFVSGSTVTVVDDSGATVDTSTYTYLLTDGQIAAWMLAGNAPGGTAAAAKQCTITATFTGTVTAPTATSPVVISEFLNHVKTARATLVTVPGGTYKTQTVTPGEVVPYGLAGYIYRLESIPQYEGDFTIQETDVTDQCPMGSNLNLTGSLAEWATMNACVQQISYDLTAGRTTLTFGPAAHLGAKDFVERLRVNRGPRWYNLTDNNQTNDPAQQRGTGLGNNVAQRGPSSSEPANGLHNFPINVADAGEFLSDYPQGPPGVVVDSRSSGQPAYGVSLVSTLGAPNKPTIVLLAGSAGNYGRIVRISAADIPSGTVAYFQPVSVCVDVEGTPTPLTAYILMTTPA